jgi:excisionase family DNA binding protein
VKKFYTPKEIRKMLKMSLNTIYEYIRLGWLPAVKLGNRYRIAEEDLNAFLNSRKTGQDGMSAGEQIVKEEEGK